MESESVTPHALKSPDNRAAPTLRWDKEEKLKNSVYSTLSYKSEMWEWLQRTENLNSKIADGKNMF